MTEEKPMTNKHYKPLFIESVKVLSDIKQHRFIGFDGNYCTEKAKALGVSDVDTEKEQFAPVAIFGSLLVEAGGTIAVGDPVTSNSEGKAVKAEETDAINGYAQDPATEGGEVRILRGI